MKVKKFAILLSVSVLLVSLIATCASSVQAQGEYTREETLVLSGDVSYVVGNFNPFDVGVWGGANRAMSLTYMSLFWYSYAEGELKPCLAKSWEWSEDGSTFIIDLHPEAVWRDGTPVTAEDVVFCFETLDQYGNYPINTEIIDSIEAADKNTVHINMVAGQQFNNIVKNALPDMPMFSKARWEPLIKEHGDAIAEYPNMDFDQIDGSGMYLPVYSDDIKTEYVRVDDWWGNKIYGQPAPKRVVVLEFATNDLEQRAFDEGTTDWTDSFMTKSYAYVMTHPDVVAWNKKEPQGKIFNFAGSIYMVPNMMSTKHPELAEPWLRQAVAYGISVDDIITVAQEGLPVRANPSYVTPTGPMADKYTDYDLVEKTYGARYIPYDKGKAIEILQEHCTGSVDKGWTWNGHKIGPWKINTITGWSDVNLMSQMIAEDLAAIGIDMEVNIIDYTVYEEEMMSMTFDWIDFALVSAEPSPTFPINAYNVLFTGEPGQYTNVCGYTKSPHNEEVNELILEMWRLPIGSEESIEVAKKLQAILVPELPYIPLYVQTPWSRQHTTYWTGWPTIDNPGPGQVCTWYEPIIPQVILAVKPAVPPTPTPTTTVTITGTATVTATTTAPAGEGTTWALVGAGIVVIVIIAVAALTLRRKGK